MPYIEFVMQEFWQNIFGTWGSRRTPTPRPRWRALIWRGGRGGAGRLWMLSRGRWRWPPSRWRDLAQRGVEPVNWVRRRRNSRWSAATRPGGPWIWYRCAISGLNQIVYYLNGDSRKARKLHVYFQNLYFLIWNFNNRCLLMDLWILSIKRTNPSVGWLWLKSKCLIGLSCSLYWKFRLECQYYNDDILTEIQTECWLNLP